jgi:hypothetical protein
MSTRKPLLDSKRLQSPITEADSRDIREELGLTRGKKRRAPLFDPEAGGIRGAIGMLIAGLAMNFEWLTSRVDRINTRFEQLPARRRGIILIILSLVILAPVGIFFSRQVDEVIVVNSAPMLESALTAPFDIGKRPLPVYSLGAESARPARFGAHTLLSSAVSERVPSSWINHCLLGIPLTDASEQQQSACNRRYGAVSTAFGRYVHDNMRVDIGVAQFVDDAAASATLTDLLRFARKTGQVGNFAIEGAGEIDYFYSSVNRMVSFSWARGPWVFSVSGRLYSDVERAVSQYVY